ncbi:MAG TPA: ATP-dependent metallopeptidase FtsH/Yme1/Tma family protein [Candidatus Aminicenantes bacterium]|nr:ATP-dependent metallopeptidase FtsH/Yme1/Tma family protein [Candidatus Aminicenantes bacterium]
MTNFRNINRNINQKGPRGFLFWVAAFIMIILLWNLLSDVSSGGVEKLSFSQFMAKVENGEVINAYISGNTVSGKLADAAGTGNVLRYEAAVPVNYPDLIDSLRKHGVNIEIEELNKNEWLSILLSSAPLLILIFFWVALMRQQSGGKAFTFGKSKARLFSGEKNKVTFKDVAGVEEAKDELQEIIEFLREPKRFQRLGGKIPKGVLLIGPPGTGKTLLARAIAGEANVPFFSISGSDFVELFVGVGASRVRDLFEEGKKHAPCLIFIDEIDAVGRQRGAGLGGGHDEREQTLNQLLVEMDGFDANEGVIIIAATNRPDILDSALLRPGRFDRRVVVSTPDVGGREAILKVHVRNIPLARNVSLKVLARSTPGFTGADIANLVNEAALRASRLDKKKVEMKDFEYAKDKVLMGSERKSMIISDKEKRITAYHEAGHALIAALEKEADPLHKVSIIPRGMALGVTQQLPLNDKYTYSKEYLQAQLSVLLAGRVSEEIFLNQITTGAGNDFERATSIARKMVCEWGMSPMGPLAFGQKDEMVFLGRDMMVHNEYSEETARQIDREIKKIIDEAYGNARSIMEKHRRELETIAGLLLEKESLSSAEIQLVLAGKADEVKGTTGSKKTAAKTSTAKTRRT